MGNGIWSSGRETTRGGATARAFDVKAMPRKPEPALAAGTRNIIYNDPNGVAVRRIKTTGNATLTAGGAITTDTITGPGTVTANALSVKTLNDSAADIALTAAGNDVSSAEEEA